MLLKRVMDTVGRFENAKKKQSISLSAKVTDWPFRDIAELGDRCLDFLNAFQ